MKLKQIKAFIAILGVLLLSSCSHNGDYPHRSVNVSVVTVHKTNIPVIYDYVGVVEPVKATEVRSQVNGVLLKHNFREGSFVKAGDSLFEIDPKQYEAAVSEAQAKVSQAQAIYKEANLGSDRAQKLLYNHVLSLSVAQQAFAKRSEAQAALTQAEAALTIAKLNLSYTKVKAPISGIIGNRLISDGSLVAAGTNILTNITQLDPVYINFSFSNEDGAEINAILQSFAAKSNRSIRLETVLYKPNGEAYPEKGYVDFTSPIIDQNTSTVRARSFVSNKLNNLVPGDFVRLRITGLTEYGIAIPEESLMQDSIGAYVYVLRKFSINKKVPAILLAKRLDVKIAKQLSDRRWLLNLDNKFGNKGQLQDGDQILVKGHFMVQAAMTALAGKLPGVPVLVTNLDGKAISVK